MAEDDQKTPEQIAAEQAAADAKAATDAAASGAGTGGKTVAELEQELANTVLALKSANKEAADRRKRLKELEDAEAAREAASLSETDKLKKELAEARDAAEKAQKNASEMLIRSAFVAEAAKANVAHPEDVYLLADRSTIEVGEDGKVNGVAEAVKTLVDAGRVPLANGRQAPSLDGGAGGGERGNGGVKLDATELNMAKAMGITPERYAAQKAALAAEKSA